MNAAAAERKGNTAANGRKGRWARIENEKRERREQLAQETLVSYCLECPFKVSGIAADCIEQMKEHRAKAHDVIAA